MQEGSLSRESPLRVISLLLSVAGIAVSLLYLLFKYPEATMGQHWYREAVALTLVLPVLSVFSFFSRKPALSLSLMIARSVVIWVIGSPYTGWLLFKLPLWSSLIIEAGGFLDFPASIIIQGSFLIVVCFSQVSLLVWGTEFAARPELMHLVGAFAFLVSLLTLTFLLRRFSSTLGTQMNRLARLDQEVRNLSTANLRFQRLASTAQERSAEDERKRITREIHDAIGYALTNLIMMMEAAIRLSPREALGLRDLLAQAREEAQVGLNETRKALRLLRNVSSERVQGLSAVHRLVTLFRIATGIEVKTEYCNAEQSYGDEADLVIYRMIQEGMTNAFRHGQATCIRLQFWQDVNGLRINLWDNGKGVQEVLKEGIGLLGMRERLSRFGGTLQAGYTADGFEIRAWIPLPALSPASAGLERGNGNEQNIATSG